MAILASLFLISSFIFKTAMISRHIIGFLLPNLTIPNRNFLLMVIIVIITFFIVYKRKVAVYLLDFTCYRPPNCYRVSIATFCEHVFHDERFDQDSKAFQVKIMEKSGFGEETCVPPSFTHIPITPSLSFALEEAETVIFSAVDDLLKKINVSPRIIDILIVNSSMFCPMPSLTAMIINRFKMRSNIISFNLSGMGCSAGIVSVGLAQDLLKVHRNALALVVSTEMLNRNWYTGKNTSMLITNCLFRMGCAALLMSNRDRDKKIAKYELQHIVRTNQAQDDQSYKCVYQDVDSEKKTGVSISKGILKVAGNALKANMAALGPVVLPYSEQWLYLSSLIKGKIRGQKSSIHIPNFKRAFEHFCIHAGGRAVIEAIEKNLQLKEEDTEASKMTLHRFGNTSSSSIWYELAYIESRGRMKRGDRIWQIAFGSGFKCNSAVWKCIKSAKFGIADAWKGNISSHPC